MHDCVERLTLARLQKDDAGERFAIDRAVGANGLRPPCSDRDVGVFAFRKRGARELIGIDDKGAERGEDLRDLALS